MQLTVLEQPEATHSHPPSPSGGTNGGSLLESAISAMPRSARILIYPSGRNARLALMDLRDKNLLGDRTIVGFADDNPAAAGV